MLWEYLLWICISISQRSRSLLYRFRWDIWLQINRIQSSHSVERKIRLTKKLKKENVSKSSSCHLNILLFRNLNDGFWYCVLNLDKSVSILILKCQVCICSLLIIIVNEIHTVLMYIHTFLTLFQTRCYVTVIRRFVFDQKLKQIIHQHNKANIDKKLSYLCWNYHGYWTKTSKTWQFGFAARNLVHYIFISA